MGSKQRYAAAARELRRHVLEGGFDEVVNEIASNREDSIYRRMKEIARSDAGLRRLADDWAGSADRDVMLSLTVVMVDAMTSPEIAAALRPAVLTVLQGNDNTDARCIMVACAAVHRLLVFDVMCQPLEAAPCALFDLIQAAATKAADRSMCSALLTALFVRGQEESFPSSQRGELKRLLGLSLEPGEAAHTGDEGALQGAIIGLGSDETMAMLRGLFLPQLNDFGLDDKPRDEQSYDHARFYVEALATIPGGLEAVVETALAASNPDIANVVAFLLARVANVAPLAPLVAPLVILAIQQLRTESPWPRLNLCTAIERLIMFDALPADTRLPDILLRLLDETLDGPPAARCTAAALISTLFYKRLTATFPPLRVDALKRKLYSFQEDTDDTLTMMEIRDLKEYLGDR